MPQSFVLNYVHIVFGTKYRRKLIYPPVEQELHAMLGATCNELGCQSIAVGGYTDHVHVLCMLSPKVAMMQLVQMLKGRSSRWIKSKGEAYHNFYWQGGYAAFAVNPRGVNRVAAYIRNQHEHHSRQEFDKEYIEFLVKNNVPFDEGSLWD